MLLQADSLACASASALLAAAMAALTGSGACTQGACAAIRAAQAEVAALQVAGADRAPAAQWPGAEAAVPWVCTSFRDILTMCSVALQSRYVQLGMRLFLCMGLCMNSTCCLCRWLGPASSCFCLPCMVLDTHAEQLWRACRRLRGCPHGPPPTPTLTPSCRPFPQPPPSPPSLVSGAAPSLE